MTVRVKRVLDLTQTLRDNFVGYPELPIPRFRLIAIGPRDGWHTEAAELTLHSGTHLDAPLHLAPGTLSMDQVPVFDLQGDGIVVDLRLVGPDHPISSSDLEPFADLVREDTIPLLFTGWGQRKAWTREYIYQSPRLSPDGAAWLVARRVRGVCIDHFSIGGLGPENEDTHRTLLLANIWIGEDLYMPDELLERQTWHVFALPLRILDSSGAPARIVAIEYDEPWPDVGR